MLTCQESMKAFMTGATLLPKTHVRNKPVTGFDVKAGHNLNPQHKDARCNSARTNETCFRSHRAIEAKVNDLKTGTHEKQKKGLRKKSCREKLRFLFRFSVPQLTVRAFFQITNHAFSRQPETKHGTKNAIFTGFF